MTHGTYSVAGALAQLMTAWLGPSGDAYNVVRSLRKSEDDLDERISAAFAALGESSKLIENLGGILREREAKLTSLQQEYQRVSELATLTSSQAEAVANALERAIGKHANRERAIAFAINIVAGLILFVIGVFTSDWVKSLFN